MGEGSYPVSIYKYGKTPNKNRLTTMNQFYRVLTAYGNCDYATLDEFIDYFPLAERQDIEQVQRSLNRVGYFRFSDFDDPFVNELTVIQF